MLGATFGSYRIERLIGEGGMGAVYAATHVLLDRPAAVKVLLAEHSANQQSVARFFNEARAATSIRHLGIVEIYDFGYAPDGSAYIAMELLEGESLAARIRRGRLEVAHAVSIARQIAGALAAAHDKGIVHRDLKPDNVFLIADAEVPGGERIKLLDFGIAKLVHAASKTHTGAVMGTPTYMSPEQCRGVGIDHRSDLYSLGCLLFEMVAGRPPFQGEGVGDVLAAHIHVPPPVLRTFAPATPPDVESLVATLLRKDPAERLASAHQVIAAIDALARMAPPSLAAMPRPLTPAPVGPLSATTLSSAVVAGAPQPRRTGIWIGMAGGVVALVAIAVALGGSGGEGEGGRDVEPAAALQPAPEVPAPAPPPPPAPEVAAPAPPPAPAPEVAAPAPPPAPEVAAPAAAPIVAGVPVTIDSTPPGADVWIDGKKVGRTPYRGEAPAGPHRIAVRRAGYGEHTFETDGDAPITAAVKLAKKPRASDPNKSVNPFD